MMGKSQWAAMSFGGGPAFSMDANHWDMLRQDRTQVSTPSHYPVSVLWDHLFLTLASEAPQCKQGIAKRALDISYLLLFKQNSSPSEPLVFSSVNIDIMICVSYSDYFNKS